jgi:hypothetical protein
MRKPTGGNFTCAACRFLSEDRKRCGSPDYARVMGTDALPLPAEEMCSNFFEPASGEDLSLVPTNQR